LQCVPSPNFQTRQSITGTSTTSRKALCQDARGCSNEKSRREETEENTRESEILSGMSTVAQKDLRKDGDDQLSRTGERKNGKGSLKSNVGGGAPTRNRPAADTALKKRRLASRCWGKSVQKQLRKSEGRPVRMKLAWNVPPQPFRSASRQGGDVQSEPGIRWQKELTTTHRPVWDCSPRSRSYPNDLLRLQAHWGPASQIAVIEKKGGEKRVENHNLIIKMRKSRERRKETTRLAGQCFRASALFSRKSDRGEHFPQT